MNLPPEVLESLAYSNFYSPSPRPIDPAVFFDLVKIRRLIDDATSLAVRAANGTTAASLTNSLNAGNGYLNGTEAEILGIGASRGGAGNAKLSRERRFRMREHATSKLYHAYALDEIAASVATMQSASALEGVAKHVLQRDETDLNAQYVHFFHEKIPSRAMAEHTTLTSLTNIIHHRPNDAAPYRTRAVTRIFKGDYTGSAQDLTEALAIHRLYHADRRNEERELILVGEAAKLKREAKVDEKDHPSSMEPQLLFHRAGVCLTMACQQIVAALNHVDFPAQNPDQDPPQKIPQRREEFRACLEARKLVRTYAKRALRDYTTFLSHFEYTPGLSLELTQAFLEKITAMTSSSSSRRTGSRSEFLLNVESHTHNGSSDAMIKYQYRQNRQHHQSDDLPQTPKLPIYKVSELFTPVTPTGLCPCSPSPEAAKGASQDDFSLPDFSESVTYHPLLVDAIHSLLLCHCLVQTSLKELRRHAYMAARVARVCDGYPVLLAARSPARADWIEVLRKTKNWIGLEQTWEQLCKPSPQRDRRRHTSQTQSNALSKRNGNGSASERKEDRLERIKRSAVREALADEQVVDEDTFRASVQAREARAIAAEDEEMRKEYHNISPSRVSANEIVSASTSAKIGTFKDQACNSSKVATSDEQHMSKSQECSVATERAEVIARWVREAPPPGMSSDKAGKRKTAQSAQGRCGRPLRSQASDMSDMSTVSGLSSASAVSLGSEATTCGLEQSLESLDTLD